MKKIILVLVVCFLAFSSFANNLNNVSEYDLTPIVKEETKNQIIVKLTIGEQVKEYTYSYASQEELFKADFESIIKSIEKDISKILNNECTVTISVTVSAGWGASYVSATVTMEADCATWKEDLRKLRDDIAEILK